MKININDEQKISEVQEEFSKFLPFLKIEFYVTDLNSGKKREQNLTLDASKTLGEIRTIHVNGELKITPNMSIDELENQFKNRYGLAVEILGKSGKIWLPTSITKDWTLEEQNEHGKSISEFSIQKSNLTEDEILF